jgi:ABC-2 type transport system permease protein
MSRARAIWLVARRELLERGRSKGFLAGLILTEVFVVGSMLLQAAFASGENRLEVGYVGSPPSGLEQTMNAIAAQSDGTVTLLEFDDRSTAEAALAAEDVHGVIVPGADETDPGTLVFKAEPDNRVVSTVALAMQSIVLAEAGVTDLSPSIESLEPVSAEDQTSFLLANVGVIFLFISIFSFGYWVLSGVVEEKQSRVVEVVLSTVRPRDLLMGKVFGIGILGLVQLLILLVTGLAAANLVGRIELPATTVPTIAMLLLWFVLGYVLYSTLFGVLGALASRMEEASNVTTPVSFLAMGAYFLSVLVVLNEPDGLVARIASFVPPAAPMVVPMRAAFGAIEPWELILSVAVTVAFIYGLFVLGGRIYTGAVLQTGGRMKLRDAWRSAR